MTWNIMHQLDRPQSTTQRCSNGSEIQEPGAKAVKTRQRTNG